MRISYISVLMFMFLLFNVYAIPDKLLPPIDFSPIEPPPDLGIDPIDPPDTTYSIIPPMPADFTYILSAGMIGISIGILLAALAYMIGNFFMFPQMIGWSKNQLWESLYTMVLVSTILVFSIAIHLFPLGVPEALENSNYSFPEKGAMTLDKVIRGEIKLADLKDVDSMEEGFLNTENFGMQSHFYGVYAFHLTLNALYGMSTFNWESNSYSDLQGGVGNTAASGNISGKAQLFSGLKKLMSLSGLVSNYLLTLLMILYIQLSAMVFIAGGSIFLFMFGVFFRCIPFTRRLGSTFIALFIVLYFIYPAFVMFVFSEGMYDKMGKDFSSDYTNPVWFEDIAGYDNKNLVMHGPFGLNQIKDKQFKEDEIVLTFSSQLFDEYNYTVTKGFAVDSNENNIDSFPEPNDLIKEKNNVLCQGTATKGEIVECDLKDSVPDDYEIPNVDDLFDSLAEENEDEVGILPITYFVQFKADALDYDSDNKDEAISFFASVATYPEEPLPFPVFYSTECSSETCDQKATQLSNFLEDFAKEIVTYHIFGEIVEDSLIDLISQEEFSADAISVTGKVMATNAIQKNIKAGIRRVGSSTIRKLIKAGVPKILVKGGSFTARSVLAAPAILIESLFLKNDISAFTYDEMTCDYYTSTVAEQYFGKTNSPEPVFETESGNFVGKFFEWTVNSATPFTAKMLMEMIEGFTKYYGQSDYTSCTGSLGVFNYVVDKGLSVVGLSSSEGLRDFHITVLFAPIVYVFISFVYTLIFCITFFKSLSESIGGDSSLMGLGKLL